MLSICNCKLINPKYISCFYKNISELVPTPSYIKKLNKKECMTVSCVSLHRNYFYNYNDRYNYNRLGYYFKNKFLIHHKTKMQETFHIIKMLNQHKNQTINCNSLIYKVQFDINGDIGISIIFSPDDFEKKNDGYDTDDEYESDSDDEYDSDD